MDDTNRLDADTSVGSTVADVSSVRPSDTGVNAATDLRRQTTGLRELTDLHRTKVPADDPRLKLERPRSRTLRRGPALVAVGLLAAVFSVALVVALTPAASAPEEGKKSDDNDVNTNNPVPLPDVLRDGPPTEPTAAPPARRAALTGDPPDLGRPPTDQSPSSQHAEATRQARWEESARARGAGIFAALDDAPPQDGDGARQAPASVPMAPLDTPKAAGAMGRAPGELPTAPDPNMQERKNDFLTRAGVSSQEYLDKPMTTPRSPYEVKSGTVIPAVLITGINSDLPGQVVGQVRENVYDTVTGNYLLIPQGSRILAAYDSMVAWGQERVLVCWNRVIRPDGSSITLDCMPGVDLAGYAGFADGIDNHWWKIATGAVFSSLLAATAQRSQGDVTGYQPSFPQVWASGASGQINQVGQQLTARNLQIQPTITVRPGFSVNILVSKDIVIPPYRR